MRTPVVLSTLARAVPASALTHPGPAVTPAPLVARDDTSALVAGTKIKNIDDVCKTAISTPTPSVQFVTAFGGYNSELSSWKSTTCSAVNNVVATQYTSGHVQGLAATGLRLALATDVPSCTDALKKFNDNLPSAATATPRYLAVFGVVSGLVATFTLF